MAERITIEKIKALEAEYEVTIPDEIKKLLEFNLKLNQL